MTGSKDENFHTQELLDFQAKLKSLHVITGELSQTTSFDDFCRLAIEFGRSRLGFDRLGLWFLDTDGRHILGSFGIDEDGQLRDERDMKHTLLPEHFSSNMFGVGEGRTVLFDIPLLNEKGEVVGHGDVVRGNLWDGKQILGWLNADNFLRQEPWSEYQIELLGLYASTLGYLTTRKRIEQALREKEEEARLFQSKLKILHEVTSELATTQSFDALCLRAVQLGRSKLGFDRLGFWFLDRDPQFMYGSFGTDEDGNIRDERTQRLPVFAGEHVQEMLDGRVFASTRNDVPIYNDRHEVVGTGWKAVAQIWNGERNIGWATTDNLLSHRPLSGYELELLSLYANTLGHLVNGRRIEEALAAERNMLRTIIDTVPEIIYVKNNEGRFILINKACREAMSYVPTATEIIGKTVFDIFPQEYAERQWAEDQQIVETGVSVKGVEEVGNPETGQIVTLLTTKVPLKDNYDHVVGLVGVAHDISDLKHIERQALELAVERERVSVLKESITWISHDLRTPLSIINSYLYLLEHITDPEKQRDKLAGIKQQTALLDQHIEEILLSARLEKRSEISRVPVNLSKLAASTMQSFYPITERRNLTMVANFQINLPDVLGDEAELGRVMDNLIQNAIAFTPDGGVIELKTLIKDEKIGVEVSDTGIGISQADLPYIFDHFFRVDKARAMGKGGMGLGLSIVKRIVEMHEGTVEVESALGRGSIFRVLLPMLRAADQG